MCVSLLPRYCVCVCVCVLLEDGRLFVWGDNSVGQIGLGEENHVSEPRELELDQPVAWISCGSHHLAIVTGKTHTHARTQNLFTCFEVIGNVLLFGFPK